MSDYNTGGRLPDIGITTAQVCDADARTRSFAIRFAAEHMPIPENSDLDGITEADFEQVLQAVETAIGTGLTTLIYATGDQLLIEDTETLIRGFALAAISATAENMTNILEAAEAVKP